MTTPTIADIQNANDLRKLAIDKVGIKSLRYPVRIQDGSATPQATIATFDMLVSLPDHVRGTHMSRFIGILNQVNEALTIQRFKKMLEEMTHELGAQCGYVEMHFPYFLEKQAPVSGVKSLMDYEISFIGAQEHGKHTTDIKVIVPVKSLCPCSKEISEYGAHNQRSYISVQYRCEKDFLSLSEMIRLVEAQASCEVFGLLKRADEKYVTEKAYDNPKFVEDVVRDVAIQLNKDPRISAYRITAENIESIHNHSAYAILAKGIPA